MSVKLPSRRLIRYIPGHFGSATMRGSSLGGLRGCLSVTLGGFSPSGVLIVAVTLGNALGARPERVAGTIAAVPRSRARCAAFRQRGLQNRAVDRCRVNGTLQAEQMTVAGALIARLRQLDARA